VEKKWDVRRFWERTTQQEYYDPVKPEKKVVLSFVEVLKSRKVSRTKKSFERCVHKRTVVLIEELRTKDLLKLCIYNISKGHFCKGQICG